MNFEIIFKLPYIISIAFTVSAIYLINFCHKNLILKLIKLWYYNIYFIFIENKDKCNWLYFVYACVLERRENKTNVKQIT